MLVAPSIVISKWDQHFMKHLVFVAIATTLTTTSPAMAKPDHGTRQASACSPGLAKIGCLPPGQAKRLYNVGHKFNRGYTGWTPYNQIPQELRVRYSLSPGGRYVYDGRYVYRVDPVTLAVSQVLTAILR